MSARTFHLPLLDASPGFEVVAISTRHPDAVHERFPRVSTYADPAQMLAAGVADLAVVTSPNDSHFEWAQAALEAGMHVLLEKPFVVHARRGAELIELADRLGRILCPFHNRRFDGDFLTVRKLIEDDVLGPVRVFESRFDRYRPHVRDRWRERVGEGAGLWYDLGPHLVDQVLCLFGLPEAITANLRCLRPGAQVCDLFEVQLHYAGREVVLGSRPYTSSPNQRFALHGERGSFSKVGFDPQEEQLKRGMVPGDPGWGQQVPEDDGWIHREGQERQAVPTLAGDYARLFDRLAQAIRSGAPVPVDAHDAWVGLRLIELAEQSSAEGRTVDVPHPLGC